MASLKRCARVARSKADPKEDVTTDGVLELSVTIGYLAADVNKDEIKKLERLLIDHIEAGLVALERGDMEQHLHFQMVCRGRVKSARSFGILVRKYMDWYGLKHMCPAGKVTCKVLTNHLLHTFTGMIEYCLKDLGLAHFKVAMHRISDADVEAGKTLHSIYGKADLKSRVILTNKNIGGKAYVWYKYKEDRQLIATMLSTLTDMIHSAMFIPSSSWIVPVTGFGMEQRRMNSFWKCLVDLTNVERAEVADVFIKKREYVRGRYFDEDEPAPPVSTETPSDYVYEASPSDGKVPIHSDKLSPISIVFQNVPRSLQVPPLSGRVKEEGVGKGRGRNVTLTSRKKLFEDNSAADRPSKSIKFSDELPDFVPLIDRAPLPTNVCLPTLEVLTNNCVTKTPIAEAQFWENLAESRVGVAGNKNVRGVDLNSSGGSRSGGSRISSKEVLQSEPGSRVVIELSSDSDDDKKSVKTEIIDLSSSDSDDDKILVKTEIIELSSDLDGGVGSQKPKAWPEGAAEVFEDPKPGPTPLYFCANDIVSHVVGDAPPYRFERCSP